MNRIEGISFDDSLEQVGILSHLGIGRRFSTVDDLVHLRSQSLFNGLDDLSSNDSTSEGTADDSGKATYNDQRAHGSDRCQSVE